MGNKSMKEKLIWIAGADWNMFPETLAETGAVEAIRGRLLAGPSTIGTGTAAIPPSNLDYFMCDQKLQPLLIRSQYK
eukprot:5902334-Karenia_brevis.AAC.1